MYIHMCLIQENQGPILKLEKEVDELAKVTHNNYTTVYSTYILHICNTRIYVCTPLCMFTGALVSVVAVVCDSRGNSPGQQR